MTIERLALIMIVRDEAGRLAACLESVRHAVDEIVIVDTGSTDDTLSIARQYTQKIYTYQWQNDFSAARNFAIEQTTCEWVLSLDADEFVQNAADLRTSISGSSFSSYCLPLCALKNADSMLEYDRFMVLRLFRRHLRFSGFIHEFIKVDPPLTIGQLEQPVIWHTPVSATERRQRRKRNLSLLNKAVEKNNSDPCLPYYLGTEWLGLGHIDRAVGFFREALSRLTPQQASFLTPVIRHLISCYKNTGRLDEALCLCLEQSQQYPEYCDLFFDGGVLFELKQEYTIALKWFQAAANLNDPPLSFFHTDGTNSYLAYYHLGHCAEKLGLYQEAQHYYEQALAINKTYYYPLYPLILLRLACQPAASVLSFLRTSGYLDCDEVAAKMAELFWTAGLPDIALSCLENTVCRQPEIVELAAQCHFYTGNTACALQLIDGLRRESHEPAAAIAVDEISFLLLSDRFAEAQQLLRGLWQRKGCRSAFWAAYSLYKKLAHNSLISLPDRQAAALLLNLADRCARSRPPTYGAQKNFALLAAIISDLLETKAEFAEMLVRHLQEQETGLKQQLAYTFTACRDLLR